MAERKVLGRGLRALIPEAEQPEGGSPHFLPIARIRSNPSQPRVHFDPAALEELKASIRRSGIVQPVLVRPKSDGYEIVCGERRFRAAQAAGLLEIPAVVREMNDEEALRCSIVENVQRDDLNPIEQARAYQRLVEEFRMKQEEVAEVVGKDRSSVTNTIRLLGLPKPIQDALIRRELTMGHARAILSKGTDTERLALFEEIRRSNLTVRETEGISRTSKKKTTPPRDEAVRRVEEELQRILGTKVRIADRKGKGKIVVEYYSPAERERLIRLFRTTRG